MDHCTAGNDLDARRAVARGHVPCSRRAPVGRIAVLAILLVGCKWRWQDHGNAGTDAGAMLDAPGEDVDAMPDAHIDPDAAIDAEIDAMPDALMGPHLFDTGLCVDAACTAINPGIVEFKPRWALWTDGAAKRRWIKLPAGTTINDTDMDYWRFPVGTQLWKEFVRDNVRVETRYMTKVGPNDADWEFMPYAWNAAQTDAIGVTTGIQNANGTQHDIPPQSACEGCHANVKSRVLGFSALQLDYTAASGLMDLDDAIAAGWVTNIPGAATPHIPLPGTATDQAALGYFHANCGHCHNSDSPLINRPMLRLETNYLATVQDTRAYMSAVNVVTNVAVDGATIIIKPGDPDHSVVITRMNTMTTQRRMPALGTEVVDPTGQTVLRAWITSLPP